MTATARKFLRGPRGIGFLYVSDWVLENGLYPSAIDLRGATWTADDTFELSPSAHRFEQWERPHALVLGLGAAADYAIRVGVDTASARARALAARLRTHLATVPGCRVVDDRPNASAIVAVSLGRTDPTRAVALLGRAGFNTSATFREWARFAMEREHLDSALRISPHYYNTEDEIDRCVQAVHDLTRGTGG